MTKLTDFERAHAESILDESPTLVPLPGQETVKILVGSVLRKPPIVLEAFLFCLNWQTFRDDTKVDLKYVFVNDGLDEEAEKLVKAWVDERDNAELLTSSIPREEGDYVETTGSTRQWSPTAWHRVGTIKNDLFKLAVSGGYDYIWLVDADVLCDPTTLQSLLDCDAPVAFGVYWTQWQRPGAEHIGQQLHAGPQVWVQHPYYMAGTAGGTTGVFKTDAEFRAALIARERVQVGGGGACSLFRTDVVQKGVHFAKVGDLPPGPMSDGEDRHLCWRANALHVPMIADAWPDIYHAYHPQEYNLLEQWVNRLGQVVAEPSVADLVSVAIKPLDWPSHTQYLRGRLLDLPALPEITEALVPMAVGGERVLRVHFPMHWSIPQIAGKTAVVWIKLLDRKPYRLPPVIDRELFTGANTGAWKDITALMPDQVEELRDDSVEMRDEN